MSDILIIILRRLRAPLITLVGVYAVSIFGLVLMPGITVDGEVTHLSLFDAFYVMSYTATTIGFGEIPRPFSYAQRLWLAVSIYLSVIGWAYTLGSIFALTQHPLFRQTLARYRFEQRVNRLSERFFLVCGYGQSARRVCVALDELGYATVIVEADPERARSHLVLDTQQPSVLLIGDARSPEILESAGVRRPNCAGLMTLTRDDQVNQAVAFSARVLNPDLPVLARVKAQAAQETLEAFGGITVVNPFETFGVNFGMALAQPDTLRLEDWLTGVPGAEPPARIELPKGHWVIAGYGRFGHAIASALERAELTWKGIDLDPANCEEGGIVGSGIAQEALQQAGIEDAVGLVAGTDSDANNLAIVTTARRLKRKLFVVVRQNIVTNRSLIEAARADMEFVQSTLMSNECVQLLTTPMLNRFLMQARKQSNVWAAGVIGRLRDNLETAIPYTWAVTLDTAMLGTRHALIEKPEPKLTIAHLLSDPDDRRKRLPAVPLMLLQGGRDILLPDGHTRLQENDRILFAGARHVESLQERLLNDDYAIEYVRTGHEPPRTWIGRLLAQPEPEPAEPLPAMEPQPVAGTDSAAQEQEAKP